MKPVPIGSLTLGNGHPLALIAGPCTLESQGMAEEVCGTLAALSRELGLSYIFKGSYDKANRLSLKSPRGPGLSRGLKILSSLKKRFGVPVLSDIHHPEEAGEVSGILDVIQIPALLCRQTDLLVAAAKTGRTVNIKKGQFMAPEDLEYAAAKIAGSGNRKVLLTERGTTFGYHQLVADFRSIRVLASLGYPVIFDASHSAQQPGAGRGKSGGDRNDVILLAKAAAATGIHGLFLEVHPDPKKAWSDAATQLDLATTRKLLETVVRIRGAVEN